MGGTQTDPPKLIARIYWVGYIATTSRMRTRANSLAAAALLLVVAGRSASAFRTQTPTNTLPGRTFAARTGSLQEASASVGADSAILAEEERVEESTVAGGGSRKKKLSVLLCPAQFCVPADYKELLGAIREEVSEEVEIVAATTAPLSRNDWIKVARQLPTKNFLEATLSVPETLGWYFQAIEDG